MALTKGFGMNKWVIDEHECLDEYCDLLVIEVRHTEIPHARIVIFHNFIDDIYDETIEHYRQKARNLLEKLNGA